MPETYLSAEELRPLTDDARLCYVSGAIIQEGRLCGYMLREPPAFPDDSGWRFFAGGEEAGALRGKSSGFYPLNTLCNYDPDVLSLLDAPVGSAYVRTEKGILPLSALSRETGPASAPFPGGQTPAPPPRSAASKHPAGSRPAFLSVRPAGNKARRTRPSPALQVRPACIHPPALRVCFTKNTIFRHKFVKTHMKKTGEKRR